MSLYTRASAALAALVPGGVAGAARAFVASGAGPTGWTTGPRGRRDGVPFDPEAYGSWAGVGNGSNVVVNFLNGLGLSGDMSTGIRFLRPRRLQWTELDALHTDAIGRRIAELPAHEATREGYQVRPLRAKDAAFAQRVVDRLTADRAKAGVTYFNNGSEPLVTLRYYGPDVNLGMPRSRNR